MSNKFDKVHAKYYYLINMFDLSRTVLLLGKEAVEKLKNARVAVFGVGGVGGYVIEALARCGVGTLDIFDNDRVAPSNINRQIIALHSTIGKLKVEVANERLKDINPEICVNAHPVFFMPENADEYDFTAFDFVVDAVDTVTAKLCIIEKAKAAKKPVISCMGTGNKLDPTALKIADIEKTSTCPLARVMRRELKKRGLESVKVLYSTEQPENCGDIVGSTPFVPPTAGLLIAAEVVRDLIK